MHEFEIIKRYFSKLSSNNPGSFQLNDDVFFDRSNKLVVSIDTYIKGIHFVNFKITCYNIIVNIKTRLI